MKSRKVIVVGASSGMGRELVRQLAARGDRVAAVARREDKLAELAAEHPQQILPFPHDVTQPESVPELFAEICRQLGGLDVIIYAAGVMPEVGATEYSFEKDRSMIEVNLTGAVAWLNAAADRFQNVGHGTIVGIGSVAGERGRQGQPMYNTTKAALKTYLEALRNRLSKRGIRVTTIKPGPTATEMTAHLKQTGMMGAEDAAERILRVMDSGKEKFLKPSHAIIFAIIRNIPTGVFRRLKL
ncbi:MAG: SDR family NAD(P)-dependent oxidoreductase [Methanoregulaceae archaeon]|nr:SDR family NAD(P)-dependent oxidoreductase [Methanoregulaceae archaeon]